MIWIDNFSKTLARQCPSMSKGVYSSCLWTGMAVFSDDRHAGLDGTVQMADGRPVPAMPDNIVQHSELVMAGLKFVHSEGRDYLHRSLVHKYGVNNIPLKIIDGADQQHQHSDVAHSMRIVHPMKLLDKNIGSNPGLVSILKEDIYDKYGMGTDDCETYVNINVDENIFWRILKVPCVVLSMSWFLCDCTLHLVRLCMINLIALRSSGHTPVCLLLGGIVTSGLPQKSCKCLVKTSLLQCSIICFPKENTPFPKCEYQPWPRTSR